MTPEDLKAALTAAKPGDVLKLTGDLPAVRFGPRVFDPPLTIDLTGATIVGTWLWGKVEGVTFLGGKWRSGLGLRIDNAKNITIRQADMFNPAAADGYGFQINGGANITVEACVFAQFKVGVVLGLVDGFRVERCAFERMRSDGLNLAQSRNGVVRDNTFHGTRIEGTEHPDAIQLWSRPTAPPTADVLIEDNRVVGMTQGICGFNHARNGVDDGGYDRITIRRNQIEGGFPHGIALYAARGSSITDNRIRTYPGASFRASINIVGGSVVRSGNTVAAGAGKPAMNDPA